VSENKTRSAVVSPEVTPRVKARKAARTRGVGVKADRLCPGGKPRGSPNEPFISYRVRFWLVSSRMQLSSATKPGMGRDAYLINAGRIDSFSFPTSCGTQCSPAYSPITYTTSPPPATN
jgi:hypothetical protein